MKRLAEPLLENPRLSRWLLSAPSVYAAPRPALNSQLPSRWAASGCASASIGRNAASVRAANKNRLRIRALPAVRLRQRDGVVGAQTHGTVSRQGSPEHRGVV